jgi:hypothetical protein
MNKAELIDVLEQKLGTDRRQATDALEYFVDTIVRAVQRGSSVNITGFGVFEQRLALGYRPGYSRCLDNHDRFGSCLTCLKARRAASSVTAWLQPVNRPKFTRCI